MENNIVAFLKRAADRSGFQRDSFVEKDIPTNSSNIVVMPFFGDIRSTCILSTFLMKSYKEYRSSKYFILASWNGFKPLFPYVNEYWSIKDNSASNTLASGAQNFYNNSDASTNLTRNLIEHFENVVTYKDLIPYYDNGFNYEYWETFGGVKRYLPEVPSSSRLGEGFKSQMARKPGDKVVVYPAKKLRSWQQGKQLYLDSPRDFWVKLIERLISEGFVPVVYQNDFTFDMSPDFADSCLYLVSKDISLVMSAMRSIGCVLDIHSGISRLAMSARCPFISVDERIRFYEHKEFMLDDLNVNVPRQYLFSFSTMLLSGGIVEWNTSVLDNIVSRLRRFLPSLDRDSWPSTSESYEDVSFDVVRQRKQKRLGVRFIKKY